MSSTNKRREADFMRLMMSDFTVETINDATNQFNVVFHGPKESMFMHTCSEFFVCISPSREPDSLLVYIIIHNDRASVRLLAHFRSPYDGGVWKIHVKLPDAYPFKPPSIKFLNKIFHPNIDEHLGTICLDVINQSWSPMFDLVNVFEVFLPQLLLYPNPSYPFNPAAAFLMMRDKQQFEQKAKEYCEQYTKKENVLGSSVEEGSDSEDNEGEDASSDDEAADTGEGHGEP